MEYFERRACKLYSLSTISALINMTQADLYKNSFANEFAFVSVRQILLWSYE